MNNLTYLLPSHIALFNVLKRIKNNIQKSLKVPKYKSSNNVQSKRQCHTLFYFGSAPITGYIQLVKLAHHGSQEYNSNFLL